LASARASARSVPNRTSYPWVADAGTSHPRTARALVQSVNGSLTDTWGGVQGSHANVTLPPAACVPHGRGCCRSSCTLGIARAAGGMAHGVRGHAPRAPLLRVCAPTLPIAPQCAPGLPRSPSDISVNERVYLKKAHSLGHHSSRSKPLSTTCFLPMALPGMVPCGS